MPNDHAIRPSVRFGLAAAVFVIVAGFFATAWYVVQHSERPLVLDEVLVSLGVLLGLGLGLLVWRLLTTQADLAESRQQLAAAAEHIPGVLYSYDWSPSRTNRRLAYLGPGLDELIGVEAASAVAREFDHLFEIIHPEDRASIHDAAERVADGATLDREIRLRTDDGAYRWVRSLARPVPLLGGGRRWHVVLIDIERQKKTDGRQRLLMRELDHRVKNNLAAIQSLFDQTLAATGSLEEFRRAFAGRIAALARTHTVLAEEPTEPLDLARLVADMIEPYSVGGSDRRVLEGPPLEIAPRIASSLSLVLHELATNAVKHGALSVPEGSIHVGWRREGADLLLRWSEHGASVSDPAPAEGLGIRLIRGLIEGELAGSVDLSFNATGLRGELVVPINTRAGRAQAATEAVNA